MLFFPGSKINLGLQVEGKRPDGYHSIQSVFYPICFTDILEVVEARENHFHCSGLVPVGSPEENLVYKAWNLFRSQQRLPALHIHLHKIIPSGTGLGGGSADAVQMLKACLRFCSEKIPGEELFQMAMQLGSDCPFFLDFTPAFVSGRGEVLKPAALDLAGQFLLIVFSGQHISTANAYRELDLQTGRECSPFIPQHTNRSEWKNRLKNVFEGSAFSRLPELERTKMDLYDMGAYYASMTGSGSAIFGLFEKDPGKRPVGTIYAGML